MAEPDSLQPNSLQSKAEAVYAQLNQALGQPQWDGGEDPVDELISTILSANTNDTNSAAAFKQLRAAFGEDWETVRTAPLDAIKEAIRPAGMYNQKAPNIVAALDCIKADQGAYTLDHLADMPIAGAMAYLTSLPGVGHKTASIVMLFSFGRGAFPVDTHVQRISQRIGLCERSAGPEKIKNLWESLLPPETYYALHVNLIRLGRTICLARTPRCEVCPLQDLCDYAQRTGAWAP